MAKTTKDEVLPTPANGDKILKECPSCKATIFQGPYFRGEIVNGEFVTKETLYSCANCHRPLAIREMVDHPVIVQ